MRTLKSLKVIQSNDRQPGEYAIGAVRTFREELSSRSITYRMMLEAVEGVSLVGCSPLPKIDRLHFTLYPRRWFKGGE